MGRFSFLTEPCANSVIFMEFYNYLLHAVHDNYNHHHQFCDPVNVKGFVLYLLPPLVSYSIFKKALEKSHYTEICILLEYASTKLKRALTFPLLLAFVA